MQTVSIIGYGRFGKTLYRLLKDDFTITIYKRDGDISLEEAYANDVIFFCVPINAFEEVIQSHKKYFRNDQLLIDVLSVKVHSETVFTKYLTGTKTQALLTHPMFGPDSSKNGFENLPIILNQFLADETKYKFWKGYFTRKNLHVIEMSAHEHDKLAASSQGLTHFIGRMLDAYGFKPTNIDSQGTKTLLEVKEQTGHDTWELFTDLQHYNPYTKDMRLRLGEKFDELYNKLLPEQVHPEFLTYGIQGGIGSFNEEAIQYFLKRIKNKKQEIKYLFTTEKVLDALYKGEIDRGQFAIHNSLGGIVQESIDAMAKCKFKIIDQYAIKISHALMIRKDATLKDIDTIMTHPQVLAQCKNTLQKKYSKLKQISGENEMIDHALVAKKLSENKLPKNVAVMGSKVLAKLYNLQLIEDNLQDAKENYTSFLQVARN